MVSPLGAYLGAHPSIRAADIARAAGLSPGYVSKLASGARAVPSVLVALRIAEATGGAVPVTAWVPKISRRRRLNPRRNS